MIIDFDNYIRHKRGSQRIYFFLFLYIEKENIREEEYARTYRSRTHEFPRERVFTPVREFSREFPRRRKRAFVRANEASRENTPPRGIHAAHSRVPSISTRYPAVRKALFSSPHDGTHARARTHRRRR